MRNGFHGFVPLGRAVAQRRTVLGHSRALLAAPGVYAVFAPRDWTPEFTTEGLRNVISPWPKQQLRAKWVEQVELVYIGCAGATQTSRSLYFRLDDLLKHGAGEISDRGPHKGGERIWQCRGWESFTLAWGPQNHSRSPTTSRLRSGSDFLN